jgi:hypothetical protein
MAYISIPASKREVGKPIDKGLIDNIHNNLEDLNSRVNGISLAAGQNILINEIVKKPRETLPVGTLVFASLTPAQFTAEVDGGTWALADGSSAVGTDWATVTGKTTLPDARGRFLRAKSHASGVNPSGDLALDVVTADTTAAHTHDMTHNHGNTFGLTGTTTFAANGHRHLFNHEHNWGWSTGAGTNLKTYNSSGSTIEVTNTATVPVSGGVNALILGAANDFYTKGIVGAPLTGGFASSLHYTDTDGAGASVGFTGSVTQHSGNTGSTGASETAPRYITENVLIKVNRAYITTDSRLFLCRVNQQTTVNNILVTPVVQGTAGNLKIDIRRGNTPATTTTSIFQSGQEPNLAWNGASGVTGLVNSNQNVVNAGQWLLVTITETQTRLQQFHLFVAGDY